MVNNAILDHIMPDLSGSGWKILCVAIRQTIGWVDEESETGRKETDRISYSQFMEKSGIKGKATVSKAIRECLKKQYLKRHPSADHQQSFDYSLNREFEMEIETGSETELVSTVETGSETELVSTETGSETELVTPQKPVQKLNTQKKGLKKGVKERGARSLLKSKTRRQYVEARYAEFVDH